MDRFQPTYHIAPPHGLLNDPNGVIQFRGQYHVFYQWNQEETKHGKKSWGHRVSKDLVNWKVLPVALEPTDWFDKNGVYSGSAVAYMDTLYLFYTGNVKDEQNKRFTYQCLAVSHDGVTFEKKGPLFTYPKGYTAHVRDPKVWLDKSSQTWYMVLGAQKEDLTGDTILYTSKNLLDWTFKGSILQFDKPLGYMWECPDVVTFPNEDVFIFSPQGLQPEGDKFHNIYQTTYITGQFKNNHFLPSASIVTEVDKGFEFYAPQTFTTDDKRVIMWAWMGIMPPENEESMPTIASGWAHQLSFPRELTIKNGQLYQYPIEELTQLYQKTVTYTLENDTHIQLLSHAQDVFIEKISAQSFQIVLHQEIVITYKTDTHYVSIERINWQTKNKEKRQHQLEKPIENIRILLDNSSIELFINQGEIAFSLRHFSTNEPTLSTNLSAQLTAHTLKKSV